MGGSQTLDQASPSWGRDGISTHPALQHRTAHAQPTTRQLEQAFDRLNPDYGVPADPHNPHGHQALRDRKPPWPSAPASRSLPPGRTIATRSCGWPARTTGPPTPPAPPVAS
jgi:hypothetical protein